MQNNFLCFDFLSSQRFDYFNIVKINYYSLTLILIKYNYFSNLNYHFINMGIPCWFAEFRFCCTDLNRTTGWINVSADSEWESLRAVLNLCLSTDTGEDSKLFHRRKRSKVHSATTLFFRRVRATSMTQCRVENTRVHFFTFLPALVKISLFLTNILTFIFVTAMTCSQNKPIRNYWTTANSFGNFERISIMYN